MASAHDHDSGGASVLASRPVHMDRLTSANLLANIRVASPCSARWADMTGDDRARFCAQCQKHVYNLSEMTTTAASDLIREKEGKLCIRFYQRADGTILTADCPIGSAAVWRRVKRLAAAVVALLVSGVAMSLVAGDKERRQQGQPRPKVYEAWDDAVSAVRDFVNPQPQRPVMGKVCAPLPPAIPSPNTSGQPSQPKAHGPVVRVTQ